MARLTIRDVALAAGVHPATASRALNPRLAGRISAETTRRVVAAAAELGYVADAAGRSLRTGRSATIGVLVPDLLNPFYPPLLRGVERALRGDGFEALIASTDNEAERAAAIVAGFRARQCDGYIIASATRDDPVVAAIVADGLPVVLVNRVSRTVVPSVVSDDARGIGQAVRHLRELGHRRIAHITGPEQLSVTGTREEAFRAAAPDGVVVRASAYTAAAGEEACVDLLNDVDGVTAILAGNDMIAVGCYAAFDRRGLRCPDDISLVGINNMPLAEWLRPALTTVAIPQEELGAAAARLILELVAGAAGERGVTLPTELVIRGSTGPARSAGRPSA